MKKPVHYTEQLRQYNADLNKATKESIQQALLYLMSQKAYNKIKVTEIVEKAGVSRSAFYYNYVDKDAVLQEMWEQFFDKYNAEAAQRKYSSNWRQMYVDIFTELKEHVKEGCYSIDGRSPDGVPFYAVSHIEKLALQVNECNIYDMLAYEGAISAVCTRWIKNGMKESIDEMADYGYMLYNFFFNK